MARLADIQAARLAGALLTGDAVNGDAVKRDAPFTLISRRKVRFWISASATLAAIILISWKVESHDSQSSGLSLGDQSPIQEKDMKFTQAMSVAVAAGSICSGVMAQSSAVQWTTASGGNGHWYQAIDVATGIAAEQLADARGATLATISNISENDHVLTLYRATGRNWAFLGLVQYDNQLTPGTGWHWATGEPLSFTNWTNHNGAFPTGAPDDTPCALPPWGIENNQANQGVMQFDGSWDDIELGKPTCGSPIFDTTAIIEWSADCNSDGIVDYGQILSGQLTDTNSNGILDICELDPCPGDINLNSVVDAVDLAMVLTSWGTSGSEYPRADVNHDGVVNGPDLGALLGGWGSCP